MFLWALRKPNGRKSSVNKALSDTDCSAAVDGFLYLLYNRDIYMYGGIGMTKLFSLILSFLALFTSLFVPFETASVPDSQDDFVPVARFIATSDTHISTLGDKGCKRVAKMLNTAYAIAEADEDYNGLDAVVFSGDITDSGTFTAFSAFTATTNKAIKGDTERLAVVAKAHDGYTYSNGSLDIYTSLTGQETDFHRVINGFHYIGVSRSDSGEHYLPEQVQWLDNELKKATEDAPLQPVFVFTHEHVLNTVFGSYTYDGWGLDTFLEVLNKYPQAVHISGHSHYPANDPRSIWQGNFTAIGDGGLAYYEFTVDDKTAVHPENYKTMTQALLIEIDALNRVLVRVLDVDAGKYVKEYLIDNVASPVKVKYNHEARKRLSTAPVFSDGAELTVKKSAAQYEVTVPQAKVFGDNEVYLYRISIKNSSGREVYSDRELSQYYFAEVPESITFNGIYLGTDSYTVTVVAEDVWGNVSTPLTTVIG